jgi:hypothetical protein
VIWDPRKLQISGEPSSILGLPASEQPPYLPSMSKSKTGGPFKFHPFLDNAFVNDIQFLSKKLTIPSSVEERVQSMTWCDVCEKHSAEVVLGEGLVDAGECPDCGMEHWGFH